MVDLLEIIKGEETAMSDRSGETPLLRLVGKYRSGEEDKKTIDQQLVKLAERLGSLSYREVRHLVLFMEFLASKSKHFRRGFVRREKRLNPQVPKAYAKILRTSLKDIHGLEKRAEVLRFVSDYSRVYSQQEIEQETAIREKYPWMWIDAMTPINPQAALKEVASHSKDKDFEKAVLSRVPYWIRACNLGLELPKYVDESVLNKLAGYRHWKAKQK